MFHPTSIWFVENSRKEKSVLLFFTSNKIERVNIMRLSTEKIAVTIFFSMIFNIINIGQTVTDYDGNIYNTVQIGNQIWLKENLKSYHYSDGTEIPDVLAYNNSDSLVQIYGLLYTWDAAMRNSTQPGAQGICPDGWHIPTDQEWKELENYLGGAGVAGGKMKDTGTVYWNAPNTGATNSSGLSILPGGEFDAYYNPNQFNLINQYAVFWTSTEVSTSKARERYLAYNSAASSIYDWFKVMNYSIRCIKDDPTGIEDEPILPKEFQLMQNFPNPFNPTTVIQFETAQRTYISLKVFNVLGNEIATLVDEEKSVGIHNIEWNAKGLASGIYFYSLNAIDLESGSGIAFTDTKKMLLIK
jgi:uncharacterized protein (TIGR02145 family)